MPGAAQSTGFAEEVGGGIGHAEGYTKDSENRSSHPLRKKRMRFQPHPLVIGSIPHEAEKFINPMTAARQTKIIRKIEGPKITPSAARMERE